MRAAFRVLITMFSVAVAVNYIWEMFQSPLFTPESHGDNVWLDCFVASLGDGVMVLLLFGLGWAASRRFDWFRNASFQHYAVLVAGGALLAFGVEWAATHVQRWTYLDSMPRIPGLEIGLFPILQMMVLPPLIFWLTAQLTRGVHSRRVM